MNYYKKRATQETELQRKHGKRKWNKKTENILYSLSSYSLSYILCLLIPFPFSMFPLQFSLLRRSFLHSPPPSFLTYESHLLSHSQTFLLLRLLLCFLRKFISSICSLPANFLLKVIVPIVLKSSCLLFRFMLSSHFSISSYSSYSSS